MGLGDVKLVLIPPLILGWPYTIIWLFLSFIIGAVTGVVLIFLHKAKFGKQIPFGPFLIISYFIVLFWGEKLLFLFNFK
jgi:leader peptidase (prepilin peptidase)/N-methyltransferase